MARFCSNCGNEVAENAVVCLKCGCALQNKTPAASTASSDDAPNTGFAVLGFLIPIVGLVMYLICKDSYPLKARSAGKGALIGFVAGLVFWIIYCVIVGVIIGIG